MDLCKKEQEALYRLMDPKLAEPYEDHKHGGFGLWVENNARSSPDKIAVCFEDERITYGQLNRAANKVANVFLSNGAKKGRVCALLLDNNCDYITALVGLAKIGVVSSLVNTNLRKKSLAHAINISRADYILAHTGLAPAADEVMGELNLEKENVWVWGDKGSPTTPYSDFTNALAIESPDNPPADKRPLNNDIALYLFTSGTTGLPKAVKMRAKGPLLVGELIFKIGCPCTSDDAIYAPLPLNHVWGLTALAGAICLGSSLVLRRKFSATGFWDDVRKHNATVAFYIGEIPRYLINQPARPDDADNPLKIFVGLGLKAELWRKIKERFGIEQIIEVYGASEGGGSLVNIADKPGMVGRILNENDQAIVKYDQGKDDFIRAENGFMVRCVEPGEQGVLIMARSGVANFNDYTDKNETQKKIVGDVFEKGDAWFNSGDLFELHDDGWLSFKDRLGDTFRWKSENVSTQQVESILMDYPAIEIAAVYGVEVPDMPGRAGMAAVMKTPEIEWDWEGFAKFAGENLPPYAIPRFIRFSEKIETTATHKLKKTDLAKQSYNPSRIREPLYFWDGDRKGFRELDGQSYERINSGKVNL